MSKVKTGFKAPDASQAKAEAKSFQDFVGNESKYHDPRNGIERKSLQQPFQKAVEQKALTTDTGGSGTTDLTMVPVYLDETLVDKNRKFTPLLEMIPRVSNQGLTADYNVINDKGDSAFEAEDASLAASDITPERDSKDIKFAYTVGRVTGPAQASIPAFQYQDAETEGTGLGGDRSVTGQQANNAMQTRVLTASKNHAEFLEDQILNADSSSNAQAFDGLITQQGTTNEVTWSSGTDIIKYLERVNEKIFEDGGDPDVCVGSPAAVRAIREQAYDKGSMRYNSTELKEAGVLPFSIPSAFGLDLMTGVVPVIPSQFLDNTNGNQTMWMFDLDVIELRVLMDTTYEEMAKTNDSQKFFLKTYATVINRVPNRSGYLDGIDASQI